MSEAFLRRVAAATAKTLVEKYQADQPGLLKAVARLAYLGLRGSTKAYLRGR